MDALNVLLPVARSLDITLALENHYKDVYWTYPDFAQDPVLFRRILAAVDDEYFGVQFDPSNAVVAGVDAADFLATVVDRVVTMQASDRYLEAGHSLDELRQADGSIGYLKYLRHGVIGRGTNDYDRIFTLLRSSGYDGWISIEDGMNGMDDMAESVRFLRDKVKQYPLEVSARRSA